MLPRGSVPQQMQLTDHIVAYMKARFQEFDVLVTVGNYPPLDFVIPTLNLQLCYNPGTILALSGSALEHGVGAVNGDRACLTYYMQANVHQSIHVPMCQSPHIYDLLPTSIPTGELLT